MKPTITGTHQPSYSSNNLGNETEHIYYFAFDNVAARQLLNVTINTIDEILAIDTYQLSPLGGARVTEGDFNTLFFQFRNPIAGQYSNTILYSLGIVTVEVRIVILNKLSIWANLSECNLLHNVFNNEKFTIKIYRVFFDINNEQEFRNELIGEFETLSYYVDPGDAVGRTFQVKLRVDQIIKTIERTTFEDVIAIQTLENSMFVMPSIWTYSIHNSDDSEVYYGPNMYTVNCRSNSNWYNILTNNSYNYPDETGFTGTLKKGVDLFTNLENQYFEKVVGNHIGLSCVFENSLESNLRFTVSDDSFTEVASYSFNYSCFYAFENQLAKLPFFFMYLSYNVQELGYEFLEYQNRKISFKIVNESDVEQPYSASYLLRKFTGNGSAFNEVAFDGFLFEDSLGGFTSLPIELRFTGSVEFENKTVVLEKPSSGNISEQRIFAILDNFNFEQSYEGRTGYFTSAQRSYYQHLLTSKFILFRRRRVFITSASFVNVDEPNGLMSIKFTFKFADNNPFYDRNYPNS